jgi:aryl-alcohol dehydrogenase-like predicted oxidoreductase
VEAFDILRLAQQKGVITLDTSIAYGSSEKVIGEYIAAANPSFDIVSKISVPGKIDKNAVKRALQESIKRLNIKQLYGCLVHRFDDFKNNPSIWDVLIDARNSGLINRIGFSLYFPEELEWLWKRGVTFDIVQVPLSIFDKRFEAHLKQLKDKNIEIHARSIFLQGLVFLDPDQLEGKLESASEKVRKLREISQASGIPINAICINEALLNPYIDKVVIGCDGIDHLRQNIDDLNFFNEVAALKSKLKDLVITDESILLPFRWNAR